MNSLTLPALENMLVRQAGQQQLKRNASAQEKKKGDTHRALHGLIGQI